MCSITNIMTTLIYTAWTLASLTCISVFAAVTLDGPDVSRTKVPNGIITLDCAFKVTTPNEKVTQLTWSRKTKYDTHYKVIIQVPIPLIQSPSYIDYDLKRRSNITVGETINWRTNVRMEIKAECNDEAMYKCEVNVEGGIAPAALYVRAALLEAPNVISLHQSSAVPEFQQTQFKCSAAVGKPEANIEWVMVRRVADQLENITMGGMVTKRVDAKFCSPVAESTLSIEVTGDDQSIRCVVYRGHEAVFIEKPVLVQYPTRETKIYSTVNGNNMAEWLTSISVQEGDLVVLNCSSRGRPEPHFTWRYSSRKGSDSGAWLETDGSSAVFLANITNNQTGTYQCVSANIVGGKRQNHEAEIHLVIKTKPKAPSVTPKPTPPSGKLETVMAVIGTGAILVGFVLVTVCGKCCGG